jgi:hypothetical protein
VRLPVDYPYRGNPPGRAFMDRLPVAPPDREKIGHGTIEQLLGL